MSASADSAGRIDWAILAYLLLWMLAIALLNGTR